MTFKAKVFKLGNSRAVYIPKEVYTDLEVGQVYTFEIGDVYTKKDNRQVYTKPEQDVYTNH